MANALEHFKKQPIPLGEGMHGERYEERKEQFESENGEGRGFNQQSVQGGSAPQPGKEKLVTGFMCFAAIFVFIFALMLRD